MLVPLIEQSPKAAHTLITADAGYHSDANVQALKASLTPALIADHQIRQRDERFARQARYKAQGDVLWDKRPTGLAKHFRIYAAEDFIFISSTEARCPEGKTLTGSGKVYAVKADAKDCDACAKREHCMRNPLPGKARTVTQTTRGQRPEDDASEQMRRAIDSPQGRRLYSQRIGTVEPVFANIRHNNRLSRLNYRGHAKVNAQWHLYCMVHNIEKLANSGWQSGKLKRPQEQSMSSRQ